MQEVRKTLIVAHVRLGSEDAATAPATSTDGGGAHDPPHQAADDHDESTRKEMARWYWGLSVFEVAVTPWRANTPLARPSKARGEEVQHKGRPSSGPGGGANGGGTGEGDGAPPCKRGRVDDGGFGMEGQSSSAEPMG